MTKKILVIEDERSTRTSIINFLRAEGFETLGAENGRVGIELARQHLPALIICDVLMPELDGYDVLTTLQQDPKTAAIPFIFLTVSADEAGFRQSMEMGADDYLSKPVTSEQLRMAIGIRLRKQEFTLQRYVPPTLLPAMPIASPSATETLVPDEPVHLPNSASLPEVGLAEGLSEKVLQAEIDAVKQLLQAKEHLLQYLCRQVPQQLAQVGSSLQTLKSTLTESEFDRRLKEVHDAHSRVLLLVNEVMALQNVLTSENAERLLSYFDFDR